MGITRLQIFQAKNLLSIYAEDAIDLYLAKRRGHG